MIKVKLSIMPDWPIIRQTAKEMGVWDNYQFFINQDVKEYDWWVVYDRLIKEEACFCPKEHTIIILGEPASVKKYNHKYLKQFSKVITCQTGIKHPRVINSQMSLAWIVGKKVRNRISLGFTKNYDELKNIKHFNKKKLLSTVTSNKNFTEGHRKRLDFIKKMQSHFKDKLDVYGPGSGIYGSNDDPIKFKYHEDKWNAIADYKYHVVIENSSYPHYWTEKLTDCFLAGAFPFYYGCDNIYQYFPNNSLAVIDIDKPEEAISIIENGIKNNYYEKNVDKIMKSRELILDKYQLFPALTQYLKGDGENKVKLKIKPEEHFQKYNLFNLLQKVKRKIIK